MLFKSSVHTVAHPQRGFGLIELLVSMSIMAIVSAVVLTKHGSFNGAVLLRNMTYEVAYTIRQAQLLAVSTTDGGTERVSYGVNFITPAGTMDGTYFIFRDVDLDGTYNTGDAQVGPTLRLDQRFEFGPDTQPAITFVRPNFDAIITTGTFPATVDIRLVEADSSDMSTAAQRSVEILSTGNISVPSNN